MLPLFLYYRVEILPNCMAPSVVQNSSIGAASGGHRTLNLVILRLSHLIDIPFEILVKSTYWFLRKIGLDYYVASQNEPHWMKGQG